MQPVDPPEAPEPGSAPEPTPAIAPPRRGVLARFARRPVVISVGVLAAIAPWFLLFWLLGSEAGLWVVASGLRSLGRGELMIDGAKGRLSDRFSIERLRMKFGATRIEIDHLELDWRPAALFSGTVSIRSLKATALRIGSVPSGDPPSVPGSFALPLPLQIDALDLGRFDFHSDEAGKPGARVFGLADIHAQAMLAPHRWRFDTLTARTDWGPASLAGSLVPDPPFAVQASGSFNARYDKRDLNAKLDATGSLVALQLAADLASETLTARLRAGLRSFDAMPLASLDLDTGAFDPQRFSAAAPKAELTIAAHLAPVAPATGMPEAALHGGMSIGGTVLLSNARPALIDQGGLPVERLAAKVRWDAGRLVLEQIDMLGAGGARVRGRAAWQVAADPKQDPIGRIDLDLGVAGLDPARLHGALPKASLQGHIAARGERERQTAEIALKDPRLSLDGRLERKGSRLELQNLRLASGAMQMLANGYLITDAGKQFDIKASAQRLDPRAFWATAPGGAISGELAATGRLAPVLELEGNFALGESRLAGLPLTGSGDVSLQGSHVRHLQLALDALGNKLAAEGAFGRPGDRIDVRVNAPELAKLGEGFGGKVRGSGSFSGTAAQPSGRVELRIEHLAVPGGHRLDALNLRGRLSEGLDGAVEVQATAAGYRAPGSSESLLRRMALSANGSRRQHSISLDVDLTHRRGFSAEGKGGFVRDLDWSGSIDRLSINAEGEINLVDPASIAFGPDHFRLGPANLRGERTRVHSEVLSWSPHETLARGTMTGLIVRPGSDVAPAGRARAALQLGAEWDVQLRQRANGLVRLFREAGDIGIGDESSVELGLKEFELIAAASDDRLAFSLNAAGARIGVLSASATAAAEPAPGGFWRLAPDAPLLGRAQIAVPNVDWLGPLLDPNFRSAGSFQGDFSLAGTPAAPVATGSVTGEGLGLTMVDQAVRFSGGKLRLHFDADRLYLDELSFVSPSRVRPDERRIDYAALVREPGRAEAAGQIELASGVGNFRLKADRMPVLQRNDRWLLLSGEGKIESTWKSMNLSGRFSVPAGYIGFSRGGPPSLDPDVVVRGRTPPGETRFRIATDLDIDLGNSLYLKAYGIDTRLVGSLTLRARPGEPLRASGRIESRDGIYDAYGQRLTIEEGQVTFQGPLDNPVISVIALRKGLAVEAGVSITGSTQRPRIKLVSSPNVPDAEKLSWIMLGRAPGGGNEADGALMMAAASVVLGDTGGHLTDQIAHTFGVDQIRLAQSESRGLGRATTSQVAGSATGYATSSAAAGNGDTLSGQVIMIGKRLTDRLHLSFEQGVQGTESLVKLSYLLSQRVSLVARAGTEQAIDLNYTISFR